MHIGATRVRFALRALVVLAATGSAATAAIGCDAGPRDNDTESFTEIETTGFSAGNDSALNPKGSVHVAFNRFLNPYSVIRQSIALRDAFGFSVEAPLVEYDPVLRTMTLRDPGAREWLKDNQFYSITLGIPEGNAELGGVRSVDGAPLATKTVRKSSFFVRSSATLAPVAGQIEYCRDIAPVLNAKCSGGSCHGSSTQGDYRSTAAMGLVLDSAAGIADATVRLARGTNNGGRPNAAAPALRDFGRDMRLIDPSSPATSWIMYKVLIGNYGLEPVPRPAGCSEPLTLPPVLFASSLDAGDAERARLRATVQGNPMPPGRGYAVTFDEARRLSEWIRQGALTGICGTSCGAAP
jgi:hypothetical protein